MKKKFKKWKMQFLACECCGDENANRYQKVRGVSKEWYCWDCALSYGRKNWVNNSLDRIGK